MPGGVAGARPLLVAPYADLGTELRWRVISRENSGTMVCEATAVQEVKTN